MKSDTCWWFRRLLCPIRPLLSSHVLQCESKLLGVDGAGKPLWTPCAGIHCCVMNTNKSKVVHVSIVFFITNLAKKTLSSTTSRSSVSSLFFVQWYVEISASSSKLFSYIWWNYFMPHTFSASQTLGNLVLSLTYKLDCPCWSSCTNKNI